MIRALLALLLSAILTVLANAQVRPDQFPLEDDPDDSNFEFYSQKGGRNTRTRPSDFRKSQAPRIVDVTAPPAATGNSANRMEFVRTPDGSVYYIDYLGRRLEFATGSGGGFVEQVESDVNGSTLLLTVPVPSDLSKLLIYRDGQLILRAQDFTVFGNQVTLTLAVSGSTFVIHSHL